MRKEGVAVKGATSKDDPLIALGKELCSLHERCRELDTGGRKSVFAESEVDDVYDAIEALTRYASTMRASSFEGALIQIGLAVNTAYEMFDNVLPEHEAHRVHRAFKRLTFSAVAALQDDDVDKHELGVFYSMGEHLNPWVPSQTREEWVRQGEGDMTARRSAAKSAGEESTA